MICVCFFFCLTDSFHRKRRKTNNNSKAFGVESAEAEEHSLSLSQHSSPSQSDQEQTPAKKSTTTTTTPLLLQQQNLTCCSLQNPKIAAPRPNLATCLDMLGDHSNPRRHDNTHFVAEELPLPFHSLVCSLTKFDPVDIIAI